MQILWIFLYFNGSHYLGRCCLKIIGLIHLPLKGSMVNNIKILFFKRVHAPTEDEIWRNVTLYPKWKRSLNFERKCIDFSIQKTVLTFVNIVWESFLIILKKIERTWSEKNTPCETQARWGPNIKNFLLRWKRPLMPILDQQYYGQPSWMPAITRNHENSAHGFTIKDRDKN